MGSLNYALARLNGPAQETHGFTVRESQTGPALWTGTFDVSAG